MMGTFTPAECLRRLNALQDVLFESDNLDAVDTINQARNLIDMYLDDEGLELEDVIYYDKD